MYDLYSLIAYPLLYILPAYFANAAPVFFGGGKPLDLGKRMGGRRIFGKNKSIRGLLSGLLAGVFIGYVESWFLPYMFLIGIAESIGAHSGDLLGSFIKRRVGKNPGEGVLLLDQYLFLVFAILFAIPLGNLPNIYGIVFLLVLTGVAHVFTNRLAYHLKLKSVPW